MNETLNTRVSHITFSVGGDEETLKRSVALVTKSSGGVGNDISSLQLGTTSNGELCKSCNNPKKNCPGHSGHIYSNYPVELPLHKKEIILWLRALCFHCSHFVVNLKLDAKLEDYAKAGTPKIIKNKSGKIEESKMVVICENCGKEHYYIDRDKDRPLKKLIIKSDIEHNSHRTGKKNETATEILFNTTIKNIFLKVTRETLEKSKRKNHPSKFLVNNIYVPSNSIRPDLQTTKGGKSSNSDITTLFKYLLDKSSKIKMEDLSPEKIDNVKDIILQLDEAYTQIITGDKSKIGRGSALATKGIVGKIGTKFGRGRMNIVGKRVFKFVRTVISPSLDIPIGCLGIPKSAAMTIHMPLVVDVNTRKLAHQLILNGPDRYPGCYSVYQKSSNSYYVIGLLKNKNLILEDGDIVYRHLLKGDVGLFNRQPTMRNLSMNSHTLIILDDGESFSMNPSDCDKYNADFDGDSMNLFLVTSEEAKAELKILASVESSFLSHQRFGPTVGLTQDSCILTKRLSDNDVLYDKYHAQLMISNTSINLSDPRVIECLKKDFVTGRELLSLLLPTELSINDITPSSYVSQFKDCIELPNQKLEIVNGNIVNGVLDKKSIGVESGSIFQVIKSILDTPTAIRCINDMQQMSRQYGYYVGFSINFGDVVFSKKVMNEINEEIKKIIIEAENITIKLFNGEIIPPIGTSLHDFIETLYDNVLNVGDSITKIVIKNINNNSVEFPKTFRNELLEENEEFLEKLNNSNNRLHNSIYELISSGSKGSFVNLISLAAIIGQTRPGPTRPKENFSHGRVLPYFNRYDYDPRSRGFIPFGYAEGINDIAIIFAAMEARFSLIANALLTAEAGYLSRELIRNLESGIVNNYRQFAKPNMIVQFLYGENGIDPRYGEKVKLPITISDKKFDDILEIGPDILKIAEKNDPDFDDFKNNYKNYCERLKYLRSLIQKTFLTIENKGSNSLLLGDQYFIPVNIPRLIKIVMNNYDSSISKQSDNFGLTFSKCLEKVNKCIDDLPYKFYNERYKQLKKPIRDNIKQATTLLEFAIRYYLSIPILLSYKKINDQILDIIILKILSNYEQTIIEPGTPIGIIACQSIGEPSTQFLLNSKHRAGTGGTKTNQLERIGELVKYTSTEKMSNPITIIFPKFDENKMKEFLPKKNETEEEKKIREEKEKKYKNDQIKKIATFIEILEMDQFIIQTIIFEEKFGKPVHPLYKHEEKMINEFLTYNMADPPPSNLLEYCIRYVMDKLQMIRKNITIVDIISQLKNNFPNGYFVYSDQNEDEVIIRAYHSAISGTKKQIDWFYDYDLKIKQLSIRGIQGYRNAEIIENGLLRSIKDENGDYVSRKVPAISVEGSNISKLFECPDIDTYNIIADSIEDIYKTQGIEMARMAFINEMRKIMGDKCNLIHLVVVADELMRSKKPSSISHHSLSVKEPNNIYLNMFYGAATQVLRRAAEKNITTDVGPSFYGALSQGQIPKIGTNYNTYGIDMEKLDQTISTNIKSFIEEL